MAHSKQALKRARQNERIREANRANRAAMKTHLKKVRTAVAAGNTTTLAADLQVTQQKLDKAAKSRILHPNAAARLKSRLAKRVAAMKKKPS